MRRWSAEKFAQVGYVLAKQGLDVCVTDSESEKEIADQVVERMEAKAHNLCGELSLNGLTALLADASLVVATIRGLYI